MKYFITVARDDRAISAINFPFAGLPVPHGRLHGRSGKHSKSSLPFGTRIVWYCRMKKSVLRLPSPSKK
jgi:hypothetical protein